jgi:two-component system, chemotaxis family, sensor kinase CheA
MASQAHEAWPDRNLETSPESAEKAGIGTGEAKEKPASHSIRVGVDTLDQLMTTVSELVLSRNQLLEIVRRQEDSEFNAPLRRLSNVTAQLQEGVMKTRMQPIGYAWQKLPRIVRDLSAELGKDIELEMHGTDTDGYLVLGAAETIVGLTDRFKMLTDKRGLYAPNPSGRTGANGDLRLVAIHGGR